MDAAATEGLADMEVSVAMGISAPARLTFLLAETGLGKGQLALIVVIVAVSVTMAIAARRHRTRHANSPRAYVREQVSQLSAGARVRDDFDALLAQAQDITRQMNAQLDTRFCKLERAIRDADERIARLDRLARAGEGRSVCDVTVGDGGDEGASDEPKSPEPAVNDRYADVYRLSEAGLSAAQVAEETGQTTGEVELILALHRQTATSGGV